MILDYDQETDAAFLYLGDRKPRPGEEASSEPLDLEVRNAAAIQLYDADGHLLGFELLGLSRLFGLDGQSAIAALRGKQAWTEGEKAFLAHVSFIEGRLKEAASGAGPPVRRKPEQEE